MPDKIHTLSRLFIYPNTIYPKLQAYIITCRDLEGNFHFADTGLAWLHRDYWNKDIKPADKEACISLMLAILQAANGDKYRYIQPRESEKV